MIHLVLISALSFESDVDQRGGTAKGQGASQPNL